MVRERIKDPDDRKAFALIMSQQEYGRPFAAPPDVPADRVQALRAAFNATMKDPGFRAEAQQAHLWLDPLTARADGRSHQGGVFARHRTSSSARSRSWRKHNTPTSPQLDWSTLRT